MCGFIVNKYAFHVWTSVDTFIYQAFYIVLVVTYLEKEEKLTIRISEADLLTIDQFLEEHPEYGSRSEFIRGVLFDFISRKTGKEGRYLYSTVSTGHNNRESVTISVPSGLKEVIMAAISSGVFTGYEDAIEEILKYSYTERYVYTLVKKRIEEQTNLEQLLDDFARRPRFISGNSTTEEQKKEYR